MAIQYPQRVQALRDEIIRVLPRVPNDRHSLAHLRQMPTHRLILAFVTWRMRLIPAKPRAVRIWAGGVDPLRFHAFKVRLRPLLQKVEAGGDLTPHLSDLVQTAGVILPGAATENRWKDIDMVLTREGLHHFHVGLKSSSNPKGRSDALVFAEVTEDEFKLVAISNHLAFAPGTPEHSTFFRICRAYMAKDIPPGQAFMANPVMCSGHSWLVTMFANRCDLEMNNLDASLDDPAFIDKLYNGQPIERNGVPIIRPADPLLTWYFDDLKFGILDRRTMVFFCLFPFFSR